MPDKPAREIQIFYLDEECDTCDIWKRTNDGEWEKVKQIVAYEGDRKIIRGVEYIVLADGSHRKLEDKERKLWKYHDKPIDFAVDIPPVSVDKPLHGYSIDGSKRLKLYRRR